MLEFDVAARPSVSFRLGDEPAVDATVDKASIIHGKSAYQIALKNGFEGTEEEWLESLRGDPFTYEDFTEEQLAALQGKPGYTPVKGTDYYDGQSIYKVASYGLKEGTTNILCVKLTDILLIPYRKLQMCDLLLHVDSGMVLYVNSIRESEGIAIVSEIGSIKGDPGTTPHIGENGNWWIGETDTGVSASGGGEGGGTGNVSSTDIDTIVVLDQEAFDALPSRPSTTFYAIRG